MWCLEDETKLVGTWVNEIAVGLKGKRASVLAWTHVPNRAGISSDY